MAMPNTYGFKGSGGLFTHNLLDTLVRALTKKNLTLLVTRHWISTLLQSIVAPIVVLSLVLNIRNFAKSRERLGVGPARPIRALAEAIPNSQQLILVKPDSVGSDVDTVIDRLASSLPNDKVVRFDSAGEARGHCTPNFRGVSNCYATIVFNDSPLTVGVTNNQTWNYTIILDPVRSSGLIWDSSVYRDDNAAQIYHLPVQLAVDNAITDDSERPREWMYSLASQQEANDRLDAGYSRLVIGTYAIVFFLGTLAPVYHAVSFVSGDRASGTAELIDAMGGGPAGRVTGAILALGIVQFPTWLVSGCLYWNLLFPESNAAIPIFWQLFNGVAFLNAAVFGASFFRRRIISSIFVMICFCCLAGGAAIMLNRVAETPQVLPLSLLFPQMNYIFSLSHMAKYAYTAQALDMTQTVLSIPREWEGNRNIPGGNYQIALWTFWVFLVIQIIVYPILAVITERTMHGTNFKSRTLSETADDPGVAVRATGLTKIYSGSWVKKLFTCGRRGKSFKALDGVDLIAQKNQILCLLGVNGAGKSTTLDLLSGAQAPTAGAITINARHPRLGVCPQKNVLFNRLTVFEHVQFWRELKGGKEDKQALHDLIAACDLTKKTHSRAGTLSGGQKRKLQLACMFVGNTTICMMDEVTTGLDPVSRRTIWNIILSERSKRSMVFTTHFLDEGEVLADHIVILSKGRIKCQGSGTALKNQLGGGYRVSIPVDGSVVADSLDLDAPRAIHQDRILYRTSDSKSAAQLIAKLEAAGQADVQVAGPTVEDVFLRVAQDDVSTADDGNDRKTALAKAVVGIEKTASSTPPKQQHQQLSSGKASTFFQQVCALLLKRLLILPRYWIGAFLVLALPIACMPPINGFIAENFTRPSCKNEYAELPFSQQFTPWLDPIAIQNAGYGSGINSAMGPSSFNDTMYTVLRDFPIGNPYVAQQSQNYQVFFPAYDMEQFGQDWILLDDWATFSAFVHQVHRIAGGGYAYAYGFFNTRGVWMGGEGEPNPTLAYPLEAAPSSAAMASLNLYTSMRSGVKIAASMTSEPFFGGGYGDGSWQYILYAAFIMTVYPCFFALYPAFERVNKIRALQISNGVRPLPMWTAYLLFDLCFVLAVSIAYTVTISMQFKVWFGPEYMFIICLLHGITGIFISYIVSTWAKSQLSSFLWALGFNLLEYFGLALSYTLPSVLSDPLVVQRNADIISHVLGLFFPAGSLFRAMAVGWNLYQLGCRGDSDFQAPAGSWWGYGFPICYLALQVIAFALILCLLDKDLSLSLMPSRKEKTLPAVATTLRSHQEGKALPIINSIPAENQLLFISHLSKSFGTNTAVSDVSLSLSQGEIIALLGPNGAGKTTIVNLIRGELTPSSGQVFLRGEDISSSSSAKSTINSAIGVCPQFDALDLLTTRQHLRFYASIKGIPSREVEFNISEVMNQVGLASYADKLATKLSGGNKRKLSLAIALMGNPAVLVLDEPSSSMDAAAKRKMWKVLSHIASAPGRSLLLTTHSMEEADALATRAAILAGGKLLALGTTEELRREYSDSVCVQLVLKSAPHSTQQEVGVVEQWVKGQFGEGTVFEGKSLGGQVRFVVPNCFVSAAPSRAPTVTDAAVSSKTEQVKGGVGRLIELLEENKEQLGLEDYTVGAPTLERVFLSVVRDNYVEEDGGRKVPFWRRYFGKGA
ncbi:putative ABC transporter [Triangularia setosa]|uniref:ABC transporter n=1 Tax=Triangularia setosa TaxID=2587417 RepID=A0AAN6W8H0_9PEZI|nr:putative ABC transporter [Podospora setosa]